MRCSFLLFANANMVLSIVTSLHAQGPVKDASHLRSLAHASLRLPSGAALDFVWCTRVEQVAAAAGELSH